jgi:hypothetical protein
MGYSDKAILDLTNALVLYSQSINQNIAELNSRVGSIESMLSEIVNYMRQ